MKKNTVLLCSVALMVVVLCFTSCATAKEIPLGATGEQITQINAHNLAALAKNSTTQTGLTLATIVLGFVSAMYSLGSIAGFGGY